MIIRLAKNEQDLSQILALQALNHSSTVTEDVAQSQGFVTVKHDLNVLKRMHEAAPSVVATVSEKVVAYALAMTTDFKQELPELIGFFVQLDKATYQGRLLRDIPYLVMGQVCVAVEARGQRLVDQMYDFMEQTYRQQYDLFVTEVAADNTRSMRVHERADFVELFRHRDLGKEWVMLVKEWNS
ncbi:MAG: GNAT family N-acetyltransferase [Bacteroidota bacterium]